MIRPEDFRVDIYRTAGGPGAMNEVAVRIVHLPTGQSGTGVDAEKASSAIACTKAVVELIPKLREHNVDLAVAPNSYAKGVSAFEILIQYLGADSA